jgi:hypothetical protein
VTGNNALEELVKKLLRMKLLLNFYVFIYEARAKLYGAEQDHDYALHKTAASSRRPPESYAGAVGGIASAPFVRRAIAPGSPAPRIF